MFAKKSQNVCPLPNSQLFIPNRCTVHTLIQLQIYFHFQTKALIKTWYKQWKVRSGCLEKVALGNSRGSSDFPEVRSPEGKSDYPRDLLWANFSDNPQ